MLIVCTPLLLHSYSVFFYPHQASTSPCEVMQTHLLQRYYCLYTPSSWSNTRCTLATGKFHQSPQDQSVVIGWSCLTVKDDHHRCYRGCLQQVDDVYYHGSLWSWGLISFTSIDVIDWWFTHSYLFLHHMTADRVTFLFQVQLRFSWVSPLQLWEYLL